MQANLMNVVLLCKNNTPLLAAKLVNTNNVAEATSIVARMPEMLTANEFTEFKRCLIAETKEPVGKNNPLTDTDAMKLAQYAHRRDGLFGEEQPAAVPA